MQTLKDRLALGPEQLRRKLDPATLPFQTTAEVEPLDGTIGQPRALDAIEFGLDVQTSGYNLFVTGVPGSGRETTVRDFLQRFAPTRSTPSDWVYVHNFTDPDSPKAIALPAGGGTRLARDVSEFIEVMTREIPRAFESDSYESRLAAALGSITQQRDGIFNRLRQFAQARGFSLEATPSGIVNVPIVNGRPITNEDFERLPSQMQQQLRASDQEIQEEVAAGLRQIRQLEQEAAERVRELDRAIALFVISPLMANLREHYADLPDVLTYLDQVMADIPEHLADFRSQPAAQPRPIPGVPPVLPNLSRYAVNVLIDNSGQSGAPVVVERNPSYYNLIGRIDYRASPSGMVTDFEQIKPGALHRANGGFLVLRAIDVLGSPYAWDSLKRALISRQIQIENLGEQMTSMPTARLRPEPIPLAVKVILIGPLGLYHALLQTDSDFQELFSVEVDFTEDMEWSDEHLHNYAAFISRQARERDLKPFDRSAVARVVEHGARLREDQRKLSTRLLDISKLVTEASYWAGKAGRETVLAEDVDQAIRKHVYRSNLVEERMRELLIDGTIAVGTDGAAVGRVNGTAVIDLGDYRFGKPSRVSARVAVGRGAIQSIEREIELSGPIHSKGFLILSGYLAGHYGQEAPLSLSATITFEQSYQGIEGDSASSTELYALLSALSDLPLDQGIAVTGSVNQYGEVQAVGGVTHKTEGFFALCQARGLTGRQGVMLPASNVHNLMLSDEVVEAVRSGQFQVWAVSTIDEGIELLTGRPAGERDAEGHYPAGSVHRLVADRLQRYADDLRSYNVPPDGRSPLTP